MVQRGSTAGGCARIAWVGSCDDFLYCLRELMAIIVGAVREGCAATIGSVDRLRRLQGDDSDFRGTVQAEGEAHCADSAVDVELHSIEAIVPFRIFFPEWRQDERAKKGQTNLASV